MDTSPRDQDALTWNRPARVPVPPQPGERLWLLRKGTARLHAELRDDTTHGAGVELQLFRDDVFIYGRRHPSRAIALEEAEGCKQEFEKDGWSADACDSAGR